MRLKERLAGAEPLSVQIVTILSPVVTQAIAATGCDIVIIDMEHGAVDHADLHAMIAATAGTPCAPLVRVPEIGAAQVKRALDMGAEGINFPMLRCADDARACVASLRYPPEGVRGWGPFLAHSRWGVALSDYQDRLGAAPVCMITIETLEAVADIAAIAAVPGVDAAAIASFDLSAAMGLSGQFGHPDFIAARTRVEDALRAAGVPMAGLAFSEARAREMQAAGYRIIGGFDVLTLKAAVAEQVRWAKG